MAEEDSLDMDEIQQQQEADKETDDLGEGPSGDEQYEVERIVDKKEIGRKIFYMVKWVGYGEDANTWEPKANLADSKDMIMEFEEQRKLLEKSGKTATAASSTKKGRGTADGDPSQVESRSSISRSTAATRPAAGKQAQQKQARPSRRSQLSDDEDEVPDTKRTRGQVASSTTARSGRRADAHDRNEDDEGGKQDSKQKSGTKSTNNKSDDADTESRRGPSRQAVKTSAASGGKQQGSKKPSTSAEEIFPGGNISNGAVRAVNNKTSGTANGSRRGVDGHVARARETIEKFSSAPVYANLAQAKGRHHFRELTVRGMFLSADADAFALLSSRETGGAKGDVEFYVDANDIAGQSDDLARQMVNTLAQNIQVVMANRL